jgi:hypothetical protein
MYCGRMDWMAYLGSVSSSELAAIECDNVPVGYDREELANALVGFGQIKFEAEKKASLSDLLIDQRSEKEKQLAARNALRRAFKCQ